MTLCPTKRAIHYVMGEDLPGAKSRCTKSSVTTLIEQFLAPPQGPDYIVCDSAFGADTEQGREVVFLDSLDDIEFRKRGGAQEPEGL